jgi:hypothetical protein
LKRHSTEWEKIFANYTYDKGLITRIYRVLKKLISRKKIDPMKKWANQLNRAFSKEEIQITKKHTKTCSASLALKEMQIQTMLRFHPIPVRMATNKDKNNNNCWQGFGEKVTLIHCGKVN